jgi:hypothetical protein
MCFSVSSRRVPGVLEDAAAESWLSKSAAKAGADVSRYGAYLK